MFILTLTDNDSFNFETSSMWNKTWKIIETQVDFLPISTFNINLKVS